LRAAIVLLTAGANASLDSLPLHWYNTIIQQLNQKKDELKVQLLAEQHRTKTNESFSQIVLSNLACGVLVFGANGLVWTAHGRGRHFPRRSPAFGKVCGRCSQLRACVAGAPR